MSQAIYKYAGLILMSGASTYNIIIMHNGYEASRPLEEAAIIDDTNDITMFVRVLSPLQKLLIATFSLFALVGAWNSWYWLCTEQITAQSSNPHFP